MLFGLSCGAIAILMLLGVVLDMRLGEATRWHPLVGFGNLAIRMEKKFNTGDARIARGALAWALVVLPFVFLAWLLTFWLAQFDALVAFGVHAVSYTHLRAHET